MKQSDLFAVPALKLAHGRPRVVKIDKSTADLFVKTKHYSRRASIFWAGFGLVELDRVVGVCVFGQPSPAIQRHAFGVRPFAFRFYELARLVIQTQTRNAASFLVAGALRALPRPSAVVSYADTERSHCGIVYQATNWIYTGATVSHDHAYLIDGERIHPMTLRDRGITSPGSWAKENGIETVPPMPKHRYFFLNGRRGEVKTLKAALKYPSVGVYPKCDQRRYDDGPQLEVIAP